MLHCSTKPYTITTETLESFSSYWGNPKYPLNRQCIFVSPAWIKVWWNHFGNNANLYICTIWHNDTLIGIAPISIRDNRACLIGSADVCDYLDFIIVPGHEQDFFTVLIEHLRQLEVFWLDLKPLHADSAVLSDLVSVAQSLACKVHCEPEDVVFELALPATWDEYLSGLHGKQRHEIRRKLRRLHEAALINYRIVEDPQTVRSEFGTFLALFRSNRLDKAAFMNDRMSSYFQSLAETMADSCLLRLAFLELNAEPAAAVMYFDYHSTIFLYNNGYDRRFDSLNVGLLSKVLSIKDGIQKGRKKYNFLKGAEVYKHRLGGNPVKLFNCRIEL